jgi:hypothetical protein
MAMNPELSAELIQAHPVSLVLLDESIDLRSSAPERCLYPGIGEVDGRARFTASVCPKGLRAVSSGPHALSRSQRLLINASSRAWLLTANALDDDRSVFPFVKPVLVY